MKTYELSIKDKSYKVQVKSFSLDAAELEIDGTTYKVNVKSVGDDMAGRTRPIPSKAPQAKPGATPSSKSASATPAPSSVSGGSPVTAPIPGAIMEVFVKVGDTVRKGQPVLKMEAMKMENVINAHVDGAVIAVSVNPGDAVSQGAELLSIG